MLVRFNPFSPTMFEPKPLLHDMTILMCSQYVVVAFQYAIGLFASVPIPPITLGKVPVPFDFKATSFTPRLLIPSLSKIT